MSPSTKIVKEDHMGEWNIRSLSLLQSLRLAVVLSYNTMRQCYRHLQGKMNVNSWPPMFLKKLLSCEGRFVTASMSATLKIGEEDPDRRGAGTFPFRD